MLTRSRKRLFALLLVIVTVFTSVSVGQAAFTDLPGAEDNSASFAEGAPAALPEASEVPGELPEASNSSEPSSDTENKGDNFDELGTCSIDLMEIMTISGSTGFNHRWAQSSSNGGSVALSATNERQIKICGTGVGTVTLTHTYRLNNRHRTETHTVHVMETTIEGKVYLRYSNAVPQNINQDFGVTEFGPAGNNTPYIIVDVKLKDVLAKTTPYINFNTEHVYFSIDSDASYMQGYTDRKDGADNLYTNAIWPAIDKDGQDGLADIFGRTLIDGEERESFIGYVLKRENDGWHIDGVLREDPPVYVVELYDRSASDPTDPDSPVPCVFAISQTGSPGVSYGDFKDKLEEYLGGSNYQYTTEINDRVTVRYTKGGVTYETTVTPFTGDSHQRYYNIYPSRKRFGYRAVTPNIYYLCRLEISQPRIVFSNLTISKAVKGSAANANEHFTFTLTASALRNQTFSVTYTGTGGCAEGHAQNITFSSAGAASITLKHGEAAVIANLPTETGIRIVETESGGASNYATSVTVGGNTTSGKAVTVNTPADGTALSAHFVNELQNPPPTGINMDIVPYVILAAVAVIGAAAFFILRARRRRRGSGNDEFWG